MIQREGLREHEGVVNMNLIFSNQSQKSNFVAKKKGRREEKDVLMEVKINSNQFFSFCVCVCVNQKSRENKNQGTAN